MPLLSEDKRSVINDIKALRSLGESTELPFDTNLLPSIDNSRDAIPFLIDLLVTLVGSEVLKVTFGDTVVNFIRKIEGGLKTELKKQFAFTDSDQTLPSSFTAGVTIDASKIDIKKKLQNDPNSDIGKLLYSNVDTSNFDYKAYEAIVTPTTDINYKNILKINYNETLDQFTFTPFNPAQTTKEFFDDYVDSLDLIDEKSLVSNITDEIFGTISNLSPKTKEEIYEEEKVNETINRILMEETDLSIPNSKLRELYQKADKRNSGKDFYYMGCTAITNSVSINDLTNTLSFMTGSTDPLAIGNRFQGLLLVGFNTGNTIINNLSQEDEKTIFDNFFKRIINIILSSITQALTLPPQIRAAIAIFQSIKNNGIVSLNNPLNDILENENFFRCLAEKIKYLITEFLFDLVKKEMIKFIVPLSKLILKEIIDEFIRILRSLVPFA